MRVNFKVGSEAESGIISLDRIPKNIVKIRSLTPELKRAILGGIKQNSSVFIQVGQPIGAPSGYHPVIACL
jgi:hypothetical protein